MDIDALDYNLIKAINDYTGTVRDELSKTNFDDKTRDSLDAIAAQIKHTFDSFHKNIIEYLKENA